jgi:hypothetical protein
MAIMLITRTSFCAILSLSCAGTNKEHFLEIASYPHHFHSAAGEVHLSTLTGDVVHDLPIVLNMLAAADQG